MFGLMEARNPAERMDALERFLEQWYGPRRLEYGESAERLSALSLPYPLRRFYASAGRRPPLHEDGNEFFYQGGAGHHLLDLDGVERTPGGRLDFFMEYQDDWRGLTLPDADDPPVWLTGYFEEDEIGEPDGDEGERTVQVCDSLSRFLVTHCVMTTLYESENHRAAANAKDGPLLDYFREHVAPPLWDTQGLTWPRSCLDYVGTFHLIADDGILVHQSGSTCRFVARDPAGARVLDERRG